MKMPFGKYAGQDIEDIPADYLRWFAATVEGHDDVVKECEDQLSLREGLGRWAEPPADRGRED